jgi:hypothetical protein
MPFSTFIKGLGFPLAGDQEWARDADLRAVVRASEAERKQAEVTALRERRRQLGLPEEEKKPRRKSWLERKFVEADSNRLSKT